MIDSSCSTPSHKSVDLNVDLQPHVKHHGGDNVEVGEVNAKLPGQVEEDEQGPSQPLAEHPVGPGRG